MRIRDKGKGGFVFRFRDIFNYYVIEISKDGYQAFVMNNGVKTLFGEHKE